MAVVRRHGGRWNPAGQARRTTVAPPDARCQKPRTPCRRGYRSRDMAITWSAGDPVQTPYGKGVVREVRNGGRLLVQIQARTLLVVAADATPLRAGAATRLAPVTATPVEASTHARLREVDLHGLRVDEALSRIDEALDHALRSGASGIVFVHGRSGGRLKGALHARLGVIAAVKAFRLDSRNPGATIVSF